MNTDIIKTKEVNVFDFSAAISNGKAVDNNGKTHEIITHSSEFLITNSHLGEACFDKTGTQQATFQKSSTNSAITSQG